jgi:transcription elongation GreA/GreB family factor
MGRAFMGRGKGDKVDVETPAGKMNYAILEVK